MNTATATPPVRLSYGELFRVFGRVALLSFGGPAGQIATMHRVLVEEKRWLSEPRFIHALNFCMLLPGPEAQQLATYSGWLMRGTWGGVLAGGLFVLPGLLAIMALSWLYVLGGDSGIVPAIFYGLRAAVLAIVVEALFRIGRRTLETPLKLAVAASSFVAIALLGLPFPLIVALAAAFGLALSLAGVGGLAVRAGDADPADSAATPRLERSYFPRAALLLALWLVPTLAILVLLGPGNVFAEIATFFSKLAVVSFGGAYAVLTYVADEGVTTYGWLTPAEMVDGLALAETTPGPLIMVLQFVGFLAAFREAGGLPPLLAGTLGGLLATWVTFVPSFLAVFLGAPFMERLRGSRPLAGALSAVSAAIVGVILNLAVWFALHTLFAEVRAVAWGPFALDLPTFASIRWPLVLLSAVAIFALLRLRVGMARLLLGAALAGLALWALGWAAS
ncbi:MAG: chromate efflux transporter [Bauldia sp.]|nr:chromate efflux transporter [Bauldia sp.]